MVEIALVVDADSEAAIPEVLREDDSETIWIFERCGASGLSRFRSLRPDLVMVNLQLPDMLGTKLVERIRKGRPHQAILVTSNSNSSLCEKVARTLGAVAYLPKPVDARLLKAVLEGLGVKRGFGVEQTV